MLSSFSDGGNFQAMCGRFALIVPNLDFLAEMLEAEFDPEFRDLYKPSYNIGPQTINPILIEENGLRRIIPARWGWEGFDGRSLINARSETASKKRTFSEAFQKRRCIIPASGFFEWRKEGKEKQPFWFFPSDNGIFFFAGLFENAMEGERKFLILTTEATRIVSRIHDRMPVIVSKNRIPDWFLEPSAELLKPADERDIAYHEVSGKVNSVRNNDPECVAPLKKETRGKQPLLF